MKKRVAKEARNRHRVRVKWALAEARRQRAERFADLVIDAIFTVGSGPWRIPCDHASMSGKGCYLGGWDREACREHVTKVVAEFLKGEM